MRFKVALAIVASLLASTATCAKQRLTHGNNRNRPLRLTDTRKIFVFGDSFVSNGYWRDFGYPEKIETIMPGRYETTTGGLNCIQYAAQQAGLLDSVYTLAMSGASITSSRFLEPKSDWMNPSLWNETDAFRQYFTGEEALATWEPSSTLFFISGGVNEITRGDEAGWDYISWIPDILDDYVGQAQMLYGLGARHFVFTNMMPVGRTPGGLPLTHFAAWIHSWNFAFQKRFSTLEAEMPGATVRIWDWNELINELIDNAWALGFKNWWDVCWDYYALAGAPEDIKLPNCEFSMWQYMWRDRTHLAFRAHKYLGAALTRFLDDLPPRPLSALLERDSMEYARDERRQPLE